MSADVLDQNWSQTEGLVTILAAVRFFSGVHTHVATQVVGESEGSPTHAAQVISRPWSVLTMLMRAKLGPQDEGSATFFAQVRTRRGVLDLLVSLQPALLDHLVTNVTFNHGHCSKTTKKVSSVLKCVNGNQDTYMESSAPEADVQIPAA